jgi:hypothetical protein
LPLPPRAPARRGIWQAWWCTGSWTVSMGSWRALRQETRTGAQKDIIADRVLITFFCWDHLVSHPQLLLPVGLFLFEFIGIDLYLSMQFLRWPILSFDYF